MARVQRDAEGYLLNPWDQARNPTPTEMDWIQAIFANEVRDIFDSSTLGQRRG